MLDRSAIAALNHLLKDAGWARKRLRPFAGRRAHMRIPPLQLAFEVQSDGMLAATEATAFDVEIQLPAGAPLLALQEGPEAVMREARISGLAEFADTLGAVLRGLRWDYEEDLSRVVGDIAAHRIAGAFAAFDEWRRQAGRNAAANIVEYLCEERGALPRPQEVSAFIDTVDALRDDLARLEKRVERLAATVPSAAGN